MSNKIGITQDQAMIGLAAYARLCYLERKRWNQGLFIPLNDGGHAEYARLTTWWNSLGATNQSRFECLAEDLAKEIK